MDVLQRHYGITQRIESDEEEDVILLTRAMVRTRLGERVMVVLNHTTSSLDEIENVEDEMIRLSLPVIIVSHHRGEQMSFPHRLDGPIWWDGQSEIKIREEEKNAVNTDVLKIWTQASLRPVVLLGIGKYTIDRIRIPMVVIPETLDRISCHNPYFMGRFGVDGDRCGNFTVQNADLILVLGRIPIELTAAQAFAREAYVVQIGTPRSSLPVIHLTVDETDVLNTMTAREDWLKDCRRWKTMWMNELGAIESDNIIHPYLFFPLFYNHFSRHPIVARKYDYPLWFPIYQQAMIEKNDVFFPTTITNVIPICKELYRSEPVIVFLGEQNLFRLQDLHEMLYDKIPILIFAFHSPEKKGWTINDNGFVERTGGDSTIVINDIIPTHAIDSYAELTELSYTHGILIDVEATTAFVPTPHGSADCPLEDMHPLLDEGVMRAEMRIAAITRNGCTTAE